MINVLVKDYGCAGINYKTIRLWRMKLIHAIADIPMPVLNIYFILLILLYPSHALLLFFYLLVY